MSDGDVLDETDERLIDIERMGDEAEGHGVRAISGLVSQRERLMTAESELDTMDFNV